MVSNHADDTAYEFLLENFKLAVFKLATCILNGTKRVKIDGVSPEEMEGACRLIVEEDRGLVPGFVMIDAADAERNAIETVFPDIPIRVCQFHMMKQCRSKARRIFGRHDDPHLLGSKIMAAIRRCQRCPEPQEWAEYYDRLQAEVIDMTEGDEEGWEELDDYLGRTWFSERWIGYTVDYGIPDHVTRDGPWSTNNYSESSFRTFDRVFLGCRANRR